jgi:hypothetical protein
MTVTQPDVEFLWWRGCPSWERALELLREEVAAAGHDPDAIDLREISTEPDATDEAFVGSPTIRVDGRDIQAPSEDEPIGLNCRVYRLRDGRVSPLPDRADIGDALAAAMGGDAHE